VDSSAAADASRKALLQATPPATMSVRGLCSAASFSVVPTSERMTTS